MGVLDTILIRELVSSPTTVNTDFVTESIDISWKEGPCSVQTVYDNGSSVNMNIVVEVSNDDVNFVEMDGTSLNITDDDGTYLVDILNTGSNYLRMKITVTSGSIDVQSIVWKGKRRH